MTILDDMCFGPYQFEVASILRESLLINSILSNSEVWYNLSKTEIEQLEQIDEELLRKVLETGRSTPKVMLYLEMGCLPIRFIVKKRRIMYLHYILHQEKESKGTPSSMTRKSYMKKVEQTDLAQGRAEKNRCRRKP